MKDKNKLNQQTTQQVVLYEIQVGGIKCTNCAKKITGNIDQLDGIIKITVNVLAEKVQVVYEPETISIEKIQEELKKLNFQILQTPTEINMVDQNSENKRTIYFLISLQQKTQKFQDEEKQTIQLDENNWIDSIKEKLLEQYGVQQVVVNKDIQKETKQQFKIEYSPKIIKGTQIFEFLDKYTQLDVEVKDVYLDAFKRKSSYKPAHELFDLILALVLIALFIIMVLIIPQFEFFEDPYIYPSSWNVFSIYMICVFAVTNFVMYKYGIKTFTSTYVNYFRYKILNMETLITIGSVAAYIMGVFLAIMYLVENIENNDDDHDGHGDDSKNENRMHQIEMIVHMFESASLILLIVILGKFLEGLAKQTIVTMTQNMFPEDQLIGNKMVKYLEPKNRNFIIENEKEVEVSLVEKGDLIKIEPGQKLLVDGVVLKIENDLKAIDSVCYGWDEPFTVNKGDRLKSGASIAQGTGILQIEGTVENSMLFKISNQLNVSQNDQESQEDGIQGLFKLLSDYFVKIVLIAALIVLVVWIILIATDAVEIDEYCVYCQPFMNSISVLVASCPCALGLAIPSVITITLNLAMKHSILLKKNSIFEKISKVKSVIFDKTGTLFTKVDKITDYKIVDNSEFNLEEIWETICLIEKQSRHPIAELLYKESLNHIKNSLNLSFVLDGDIEFNKKGLKATLQQKQKGNQPIKFLIGNKGLMQENNIKIDEQALQYLESQGKSGNTCLLLALNEKLVFQISLDNTANLREEAPAVIEYLQKELKKDVYILSGDAKETVQKVGQHLNIPDENLIGETDAESKKKLIQTLKEKTGKEVMMIGDGLNDILSIQEAGIGVTINAKSELNLLASDVVALNENLWKIVSIFKLMKTSKQFILMNLFWASIYNIIMLPISAGVFYSLDVTISPTIASAAMSGSSLVVVLFSSLMRLIQFDVSQSKTGKKYVTNAKNRLGNQQKYIDAGVRKQELVNQLK